MNSKDVQLKKDSVTDSTTICLKCPECEFELCGNTFWMKKTAESIAPEYLFEYTIGVNPKHITNKSVAINKTITRITEAMWAHIEKEHPR